MNSTDSKKRLIVFSTHVEVNRCRGHTRQRARRFLHARGGEPKLIGSAAEQARFLHARGGEPVEWVREQAKLTVFSTHVEVNRSAPARPACPSRFLHARGGEPNRAFALPSGDRFLHARGGEPTSGKSLAKTAQFSPRTWR